MKNVTDSVGSLNENRPDWYGTEAQSWVQGGKVRLNAFRKNLVPGLQSFATGYPVNLSPARIGAFSDPSLPSETNWTGNHLFESADQLQLLFQSRLPEPYYLGGDGSTWRTPSDSTEASTNVADRPIIDATGMVILRRLRPNPNDVIKRPFDT